METFMMYFNYTLAALVPVSLVAALVLMVRYPGKWRRRLGRCFLALLVPALLLFLGNRLLGALDLTWRSAPRFILQLWMRMGALAVLVCTAGCLGEKLRRHCVLRWGVYVVTACAFLVCLYWSALYAAYSNDLLEERVVSDQGQRIVAADRSYMDYHYDYYCYCGPLFRGRDTLYTTTGEGWGRWEDDRQ